MILRTKIQNIKFRISKWALNKLINLVDAKNLWDLYKYSHKIFHKLEQVRKLKDKEFFSKFKEIKPDKPSSSIYWDLRKMIRKDELIKKTLI